MLKLELIGTHTGSDVCHGSDVCQAGDTVLLGPAQYLSLGEQRDPLSKKLKVAVRSAGMEGEITVNVPKAGELLERRPL